MTVAKDFATLDFSSHYMTRASGQEMKLGAILRNSRSYKKAKLVASQTPAEETEPESLL